MAHIDGLVQEKRNSIANALELRLSCPNPLTCRPTGTHKYNQYGFQLGMHSRKDLPITNIQIQQKFLTAFFQNLQSDCYKIVAIPWQHSCNGMHKIMLQSNQHQLDNSKALNLNFTWKIASEMVLPVVR